MRNNILGALVIFFVVVTCLLMLDDISSTNEVQSTYEKIEAEQSELLDGKYLLNGNVEVNSEKLYLAADNVEVVSVDDCCCFGLHLRLFRVFLL